MFRFIKKRFFTANIFYVFFFSCNVLMVNPLECATMNNQNCKIRIKILDMNSHKPLFYPLSNSVNKYRGSSMIYMQNYVFLMLLKT